MELNSQFVTLITDYLDNITSKESTINPKECPYCGNTFDAEKLEAHIEHCRATELMEKLVYG